MGVALVPWACQYDRRLAVGRKLDDLSGDGQRIEQQHLIAVVDCVGRNHSRLTRRLSGARKALAKRLVLGPRPVRVRCLPVPQARPQLAHGRMLNHMERNPEFYAARDQRTRASAIRSQERRRLRSSARAAAARRFAGIAARRASTARLSRTFTWGTSCAK